MWLLGKLIYCFLAVTTIPIDGKFEVQNDLFFGYGGNVDQKMMAENGKEFTRPSSFKRLEVLANDGYPLDETFDTCKSAATIQPEDVEKLKFEEVAQVLVIKFFINYYIINLRLYY